MQPSVCVKAASALTAGTPCKLIAERRAPPLRDWWQLAQILGLALQAVGPRIARI